MSWWFWVPLFWLMQVTAVALLKYGSMGRAGDRRRWYTGFVVGNLVGAGSIYPLMRVYEALAANPNLAMALATAGAAVCCQLVLAWVFRSRLSWVQWTGIALVILGIALATLGAPPSHPEETAHEQTAARS